MPKDANIIKGLIDAILTGNTAIVAKTLDENKDIDINEQYSHKHTLLHYAAIEGNFSLIQLLIKRGANPKLLTEYDETPADLASNLQKKEVAEYLENEARAYTLKKQFSEAILKQNLEEARKILAVAPKLIQDNLNKVVKDNKTLLDLAFENNDIAGVKFLIKLGANPNIPDKLGDTLITRAAQNKQVEMCKGLIETGAFLDQRNDKGDTALIIAAKENCPEIVKLLVESDSMFTLNHRNLENDTALMIAARKGYLKVARHLCQSNTIALDHVTPEGDTSLIMAAKSKNVPMMDLLLKTGKAPVNAVNKQGFSALLCVIYQSSLPGVKLLCKQPLLRLEGLNDKRETPLISAILTGNSDIVREVIMKTPLLYPSLNGRTPLVVARAFGYTDIVKILMENERKQPDSLIQFNKSYNIIKEAGHVMGMNNIITLGFSVTQVKFKINSSFFSSFEAVKLLCENISDYNQFIQLGDKSDAVTHSHYFREIEEAFLAELDYLKFENPEAALEKLSKRYKDGKLVIIPCNWEGHSTTIALYKDNMIVCNRGEGGTKGSGTLIYKIKDPKLITASFMASLYPKGNPKKRNDIVPIYKALVTIPPFAKLPSKGQKHNTCAFVNAKSAIEGILFVFEKERLQQKEVETRESQTKLQAQALMYAETQYKKFTSFIREKQIEKLIRGIKNDSQNKVLYELLLCLLFEKMCGLTQRKNKLYEAERIHMPKGHKMLQDLKRAKNILLALDDNLRKNLIDQLASNQESFFDYLKEASKHGQTELLDILVKNRGIKLDHGKPILFNTQTENKYQEDAMAISPTNQAKPGIVHSQRAVEPKPNNPKRKQEENNRKNDDSPAPKKI